MKYFLVVLLSVLSFSLCFGGQLSSKNPKLVHLFHFNGRSGFQDYLPSAPSGDWSDIATSSDGTKQIACQKNGKVYVSLDSGYTWLEKLHTANWYGVSTSSNGSIQCAVAYGGRLHLSSDYGITWSTVTQSNQNWTDVDMSLTGQYITACSSGDYVYVSTNSGSTFSQRAISKPWKTVAISGDGSKQVVGGDADATRSLYTSLDYGLTWNTETAFVSLNTVNNLKITDDGSTAVFSEGKDLWYSTNTITTWRTWNTPIEITGCSLSISSYNTVYIISGSTVVYKSSYIGNSWVQADDFVQNWSGVCSYNAGDKFVAISSGLLDVGTIMDPVGSVYNWHNTPSFREGILNSSLTFVGCNGSKSLLGDGIDFSMCRTGYFSLMNSNSYTGYGFMMWVKITQEYPFGTEGCLLSASPTTFNVTYTNSSAYPTGSLTVQAGASYMYFDDLGTSMNKWFHLALIFDSTSGEPYCYINGKLIPKSSGTAAYSSMSFKPLRVGGQTTTGGFKPVLGQIDEFAIFKNFPTKGEVEQMYLDSIGRHLN